MSDDIEEIGHHAFSGLRNLKEIIFSKNLKTIILCMFALCENGIITNPINITSNEEEYRKKGYAKKLINRCYT